MQTQKQKCVLTGWVEQYTYAIISETILFT